MAQYKRKSIANNAIGADQIALDNNKFLKAENFAKNGFVDILKVNAQDKIEFPVIPLMPGVDATEPNQLIRLAQLESEVAILETADATNLQAAKDYADGKANTALVSAKAYTDAQIAAIPPVDLSAYETIVNVNSKDASTLQAAKDYTDAEIAAIPSVDLSAYETIVNVNSKDAATLQAAKDYTDAEIAAIPAVDLSNYYNKTEVDNKDSATLSSANLYTDNAIVAIPPVDLSAYATEQYVDDAIAAIPPVDLSAYETIVNVDSKDASTLQAAKDYTDSQIASVPTFDPANYYNKTEVDNKDSATLSAANLYTDNAIAAIPPVDLSTIEGDIDQLQLDVNAVELVANQAQLEVDAVELRVGTLETEMDTAQSDIVSLDGRVDILEGLVLNVSVHTGNFNASPYKIHLVSGESIVKLPSPGLNKIVTVKKTGSDLVTLEPHQTEQIEGAAANYLLTSTRQSVTLVSDGTDWFII